MGTANKRLDKHFHVDFTVASSMPRLLPLSNCALSLMVILFGESSRPPTSESGGVELTAARTQDRFSLRATPIFSRRALERRTSDSRRTNASCISGWDMPPVRLFPMSDGGLIDMSSFGHRKGRRLERLASR